MVDYSFLDKAEPGRVEFIDVDLPERITEPTIRKLMPGDEVVPAGKKPQNDIEIVRERMKKGDKKIDEMGAEVKKVEFVGQAGFDKATEMIGQVKKLKSRLEMAVNEKKDPIWEKYKTLRNILTTRTAKLDGYIETLLSKQNAVSYELEMERRDDKRKADEAAADLQAKIDADQKKLDDAEKKTAKEEKREPVYMPPVIVNRPVIPKTIAAKTESGTAKTEMVLVPTITNLKEEYVIDKVIYYFEQKFMDLAQKAAEKAIKAGAIGLNGAPGITVEEKAVTKHRRR